MSFIFSLVIFLVVTFIFCVIVTCFVAVVSALFALIVSKDEHRAENSINAVLSSIVFGIVFCAGILVTHFVACGDKTDFGFGDFRFVRLYNCSLESIDDGPFYCTDAEGRTVIDNLEEVCQTDSLLYAKLSGDSIVILNLLNGVVQADSVGPLVADFHNVGHFYNKKNAEITETIRTLGFSLSVVVGLLFGFFSFVSLRKSKDGMVSRLRRTPVIRRLFV